MQFREARLQTVNDEVWPPSRPAQIHLLVALLGALSWLSSASSYPYCRLIPTSGISVLRHSEVADKTGNGPTGDPRKRA
jgi:hypothetical protein